MTERSNYMLAKISKSNKQKNETTVMVRATWQ